MTNRRSRAEPERQISRRGLDRDPVIMSEHYYSAEPSGPDHRRDILVTLDGHERTFTTASGVFSGDGLDHATAVLLNRSEVPEGHIRVLDLGCGWGAMACAVALANSNAEVWAVDVNERALELTRINADRHGLSIEACPPDAVPDDLQFDAIWSNPPIRIGKTALHDLLLQWLPRLAPAGEARLVVGKNLGADSLQRWLIEQGFPTERVASERGFRVLSVRRST